MYIWYNILSNNTSEIFFKSFLYFHIKRIEGICLRPPTYVNFICLVFKVLYLFVLEKTLNRPSLCSKFQNLEKLNIFLLVYGRIHPGPIRQKWSGSPRLKYEAYSLWPNHWGTCFSPFLQHNTEGPIRVMVRYIPAPFGRVHPSPMM